MENRCPKCGTTLPQGVPAWVRQLTVGQIMTPSPVTLGPEDSLMRALEVMRMRSIRRIPIVVADTLVGLLAEGDLKRAQPSALSDSQEEFNRVMERRRAPGQDRQPSRSRDNPPRGRATLPTEVRRPARGSPGRLWASSRHGLLR